MEEGNGAVEVGKFRWLDGGETAVSGSAGDGVVFNGSVEGLGLECAYAPSETVGALVVGFVPSDEERAVGGWEEGEEGVDKRH
jgi:hypothetical protein